MIYETFVFIKYKPVVLFKCFNISDIYFEIKTVIQYTLIYIFFLILKLRGLCEYTTERTFKNTHFFRF